MHLRRSPRAVACVVAAAPLLLLALGGCSVSLVATADSRPGVRAVITSSSRGLSERLGAYQAFLDSVVSDQARKTRRFRAVRAADTAARADYDIVIRVDSVYVVPADVQRRNLGIRDSVYAELDKRTATGDSANTPASSTGTAMASVASALGMDSVPRAINTLGLTIVEDAVRSNLDRSARASLRMAAVRPRLTGEIRAVRTRSGRVTWRQKAVVEDEYRRVVDYEEQLDMLLRGLVAKMRFVYETPWLAQE